LKEPEKKSVVTVEINEIINKLIAAFMKKAKEKREETKIDEMKDLSQ